MIERPLRNHNEIDGAARVVHRLPQAENSGYLRSRVLKRSIVVGRHKTSVSLEDVFWNELRNIAHDLGIHLSQLVARIDADRQHGNLSSAIRLFVFEQRCRHEQDEAGQQVHSA